MTDKTSQAIIEHSIMFADNVLKQLVAHTINRNIDELFDSRVRTSSKILITIEDRKYTMGLSIVDRDYMLDLGELKNEPKTKEHMVSLLNAVKVLYCPIKEHMKKWSEDNHTEFNYVLQIGLNTTLFIDKDSEKRIGIVLEPVP
jgi:hypothetical protein